eukprot:gene10379-12273_t
MKGGKHADISSAQAPGDLGAMIAERDPEGGLDSSDDEEATKEKGLGWSDGDDEVEDVDSDDSDAEQQRNNRRMESYIDKLYDYYNQRKVDTGRAVTKRKKRAAMGDLTQDDREGGRLFDGEEEGNDELGAEGDSGDEAEEENPLLVDLEEKEDISKEAMAMQWFNQPLFSGVGDAEQREAALGGDSDDDGEEEEEGGRQAKPPARRQAPQTGAQAGKGAKKKGNAAADDYAEDGDWSMQTMSKKKQSALEEQFEEVKMKEDGSDDSDDEEDKGDESESDSDVESDVEKLATDLAIAKKMLVGKEKNRLIEAAYNRYNFHDTDLAPEWFQSDERRHMRAMAPVNKMEVAAEKGRLQAIDARPIKKVAEAKARKRMKASKKLDAAKKKASNVAAQEDMSAGSRSREIERIYAKAHSQNTRNAVHKKGKGKSGPALDRRQLADKRGQKASDKRK